MNRVVHFETNAPNTLRGLEFYSNVFGWKIDKWDGPEDYWLITAGDEGEEAINGGFMESPDEQPRALNTIQVSSVDKYVTEIIRNGGRVISPKVAIPRIGYLAYCSDSEGVTFGIMHPDPRAK